MATKKTPKDYSTALEELQGILQKLEAGNIPVEEMASSMERANALLEFCRTRLRMTEAEVRKVQGKE